MTPISLWFMDVSGRYTELTMVYEPTNTSLACAPPGPGGQKTELAM